MGLFDKLKFWGKTPTADAPPPAQAEAEPPPEGPAEDGSCRVTFVLPGGSRREVTVQKGQWILDAGLQAGLDLPYSCRSGACSTCCGRLRSGQVDQTQQAFLDDDQMEQGYVLICSANALTSCVIETHKEGDV